MADFAHYIPRKVVQVRYQDPDDLWFAENQPEDQGFQAPTYHVTRATTGPAARVAEGDRIWLFAQLSTPWGRFPPALDAVVEVRRVVRRPRDERGRPGGFRYEAGERSRWFPLCDATACVARLWTRNAAGGVVPLLAHPGQPIGRALRRMRELADAAPLCEWADELGESKFDFVSYRLIDGTRPAFEHAIQLVRDGRAVFWDRWSLPRRLAERREFLGLAALDSRIEEMIRRADRVWGIRTPRYGEWGSYAAREMAWARDSGKLHLVPATG